MRWVLERGQSQESGDGRRWLDGAIFDITVRRAAEQALREKEVVEAQLAEVRASRARILDAADRARHEIERNLHDGAQQRFVSVALELQRWLAPQRELSDHARGELDGVLTELRTGLAELRDLARGLHPAILTDRGLERALTTLADHATVPVELRVALPNPPLAMPVEAAAYFTVCEALTNIAKHARATHAWVNVEPLDGHLGVEVGDDGAGGADLRRRLWPSRASRPHRSGKRNTDHRQPARRRHGPASAAANRLIAPGARHSAFECTGRCGGTFPKRAASHCAPARAGPRRNWPKQAASAASSSSTIGRQQLRRHGLLERQPPRLRPPRRGQIHIDRTRDDKLTPSRVAQHEPYALSLGSSSGRDQSSSYEDDLTALGASSIPASRPSASRITGLAYAAA